MNLQIKQIHRKKVKKTVNKDKKINQLKKIINRKNHSQEQELNRMPLNK